MLEKFHNVGNFYGTSVKPLRFEADVYECEVIGEIPEALQGTLYRVGPDRQYPSLEGDVIINGDGMISFFRFDNGHVQFKSRYVQTERLLRERQARRRLYGSYRNRFTDDPETEGTDRDNTGNTYAFYHAGKLFALREDSLPHQIDPDTLETLPKWNFNGALKSINLTAHPKIDPLTGEWISFAMFAYGQENAKDKPNTDFMLHVIDKGGNLYRQEAFKAPFPGISHDFAVTREHFIFGIMPLTLDLNRARAGGSFFAYDPGLAPCWGIMPRAGTVDDLRWFSVPHSNVAHVMNAYTEGSKVHIDADISRGNVFTFFPAVDGSRTEIADGIATITRLTFDLAEPDGNAKMTPFPGAVGGLPRIDDRYAMTRYRYGFFMSPAGVSRLDWETGEITCHATPAVPGLCQEPVFVPRHPQSPEGDGYLLCLFNKFQENTAELLVLDATNLAGPALAKVQLPFNQPFAFHGCFVPDSQR